MIEISDLLNVPYKDRGRNKLEGFDCYGLAIEVYKRMGYQLPDVFYENHNVNLVSENLSLFPNMGKIDTPEYGALLEMELNNELHIGVCLDSKNFIHTTDKGVRVNHIGSIQIRGIWKWF